MFSDWTAYFWQQILQPWSLRDGIFNLPWLFIVLQPLRPLGQYGALFVLQGMSLFVIIRMAHDMRIALWRQMMVLLSPMVLFGLFMGQFDGLFLAAYYLPAGPSLFLALAKPQTCGGAAIAALQRRPLASICLGTVLILSAWLIWGWPFACTNPTSGGPLTGGLWNWTLGIWPWSLVLLPLLFKDYRWRLALSPFLLPYAGVQSLIGTFLVVATTPAWAFVPAWLFAWLRWAYQLRLLPSALLS